MDLVLDNLNLVKYIAHRYARNNYVPFDDCFQEGCIGLMRAAKEYIEGDVPFSSYAGKHISWAITSYFRNNGAVYAPSHIKDAANMIKSRGLEEVPTKELVKILNRNEFTIDNAKTFIGTKLLTFDKELEEGINMYSIFAYEVDFDTAIFLEEVLQLTLERYREPLRLYVKGYSNADIGKKLGITEKQAKGLIMTGKARIRAKKGEILNEIYSV